MKKIFVFIFLWQLIVIGIFSDKKIAVFEEEIKGILSKVSPSIVKVVSENHRKYVATGIVFEKDFVLTSTLITAHPYKKIYIETAEGKKYPATLIGKDRYSSISLLKTANKNLKPIRITKNIEVGDWVALIGVFYNRFPSIFQGIVSSIAQEEFIVNAPVAPGSSGGAIVNKNGDLVAVIRGSFGFSVKPDLFFEDNSREIILQGIKKKMSNLCYAVPLRRVLDIFAKLKKFGKIKRGWLGVTLSASMGSKSVVITKVLANSPAKLAGIKVGDSIISINGKRIRGYSDVGNMVRSFNPGEVVKVEVQRNRKLENVLVKIGELNDVHDHSFEDFRARIPDIYHFPEISATLPKAKSLIFNIKGSKRLGVDVIEITPELAEKFNVRNGFGLMISKVYKRSAAYKAKLDVGDIIVRVNDKEIKSAADIRRLLSFVNQNDSVVLELYRKGIFKKIRLVPDLTKEYHLDFSRFGDFFKNFDLEVYNKSRLFLEKEINSMKIELKKIQEDSEGISKEKLKNIREKIKIINRQISRYYEQHKRKLEEENIRMRQKLDRIINEELRLRRKIDEIKRKIKEKTEKALV